MKTANLSNFGTIIVSFLAASCCIGPAIFVIFGVSFGFLGKFSVLEPFKPYFLGLGFLMLGFSFWKLYLKKQDCNCKEDIRSRRIARSIWWVGFFALVFAATYQKLLFHLYR